jgi:hypothetical protein
MNGYVDSSERKPSDFFLFTLGFLGFLIAAAGVIVTSPVCALVGVALKLLAISSFGD